MTVRRLCCLLLATAMATIPVAPPEHVHEVDHDGRHEHLLHRHEQPHWLEVSRSGHEPAALVDHDDDDAPVVTSRVSFTTPTVRTIVCQPSGIIGSVPALADRRTAARSTIDVEDLIHSPPHAPASLRAPPFDSAS